MSERTLILVKPDGVARGLTGEVLSRVERRGYKIVALQQRTITAELAEQHYGEHVGKPFFADLVEFITSGPLVAAVAEGPGVVGAWRTMMGATDPKVADPGTVRGDFATEMSKNVTHGSDSTESAEREIGLFFPDLG
ncbi:MAG: nucleoside-diphosphate kinase [Candidatus Nanopelagicales bacterium]|jgi:nucleoside-diphosphate kinase